MSQRAGPPLAAASFALLLTIVSQPSTFLVQRPAVGWSDWLDVLLNLRCRLNLKRGFTDADAEVVSSASRHRRRCLGERSHKLRIWLYTQNVISSRRKKLHTLSRPKPGHWRSINEKFGWRTSSKNARVPNHDNLCGAGRRLCQCSEPRQQSVGRNRPSFANFYRRGCAAHQRYAARE